MEKSTQVLIILCIIAIIWYVIVSTENFKNSPLDDLFSYKPKQHKYDSLDPIRFHARLDTNKSEDYKDYQFDLERPEITNDTMAAVDRFHLGEYGVDINRRVWPGFNKK